MPIVVLEKKHKCVLVFRSIKVSSKPTNALNALQVGASDALYMDKHDKWPTRVPFIGRMRRSAKEKAITCPPSERNTEHANCPLSCPFSAQNDKITL